MGKLIIPKNYDNPLSYLDSEIAIKIVKDQFEKRLADWKSSTDNKTEDERFEDFEEIFIDLQQVFDLNPQFNMNKYLKKYPDRY